MTTTTIVGNKMWSFKDRTSLIKDLKWLNTPNSSCPVQHFGISLTLALLQVTVWERKREREEREVATHWRGNLRNHSFIVASLHSTPIPSCTSQSGRRGAIFHLTVAQTAQSSVQLVIRSHYKGRTSSTYKFRATDTLKTISTEITLTKDWDWTVLTCLSNEFAPFRLSDMQNCYRLPT